MRAVGTGLGKPILKAVTAAADLEDLTSFLTMMSKGIIMRRKKFILMCQGESAAAPETPLPFLPPPPAPRSGPHIGAGGSRKLRGRRWPWAGQPGTVSSGWEPWANSAGPIGRLATWASGLPAVRSCLGPHFGRSEQKPANPCEGLLTFQALHSH